MTVCDIAHASVYRATCLSCLLCHSVASWQSVTYTQPSHAWLCVWWYSITCVSWQSVTYHCAAPECHIPLCRTAQTSISGPAFLRPPGFNSLACRVPPPSYPSLSLSLPCFICTHTYTHAQTHSHTHMWSGGVKRWCGCSYLHKHPPIPPPPTPTHTPTHTHTHIHIHRW